MKYSIRECCDVVFRAKTKQTLGNKTFFKDEPVLYFDSLKTSSLEGQSSTVYATGGKGGARLMAWDGEKTLTFNMEDALIAPEGIAILTGAGLIAATDDKPVYTHVTENIYIDSNDVATITKGAVKLESVTLSDTPEWDDKGEFGVYLMLKDPNGDIVSEPFSSFATGEAGKVSVNGKVASANASTVIPGLEEVKSLIGYTIFADYYVKKKGDSGAMQIDIAADKFAGSYYIEGSTLWRDYYTGRDDAAEIIIPNGKIQTNFTFTMAGTGDPSERLMRSAA